MRLNPTTTLTPDDWIVDIVCIGWNSKTYRKRIGVSAHIETEEQAVQKAWNSLMKRGHRPQLKDAVARRRFEMTEYKELCERLR